MENGGVTDDHLNSEILSRSELFLSTPFVKPMTEEEKTVAGIWQQFLNLDEVGTEDDFFEIGGDSLAATVLASSIEESFNCKFSPSSIIENSTIVTQAAYLSQQGGSIAPTNELPSCLTLFNASGTRPPLFLVHGRLGFTLYDKSFLDGFDNDQPIGFLEAPGLDGREAPLNRIKEYAALYLKALRQVAPEGNWQIAANCSGNVIVLEMCLLAEKQGEKVARMIMVDPINGDKISRPFWLRKKWRKRKNREIKDWYKRLIGSSSGTVEDKITDDPELVKFFQKQKRLAERITLRTGGTVVPSRIAYDPDAMQKVCYCLDKAYDRYVLRQSWPGQSFILSTEKRVTGLGIWKQHLPNVLFRIVDYDHQTLFRAGLPEVTRFMNDSILPNPEERFDHES